jgi:hypothetical protein
MSWGSEVNWWFFFSLPLIIDHRFSRVKVRRVARPIHDRDLVLL